MMLRKLLAATAALALTTAPLAGAAAAPVPAPAQPAGEAVTGQAQFLDGFGAHWVIIGVVALAVLVFVVLDDDDDPVSP